jgi:hypothetical protein
MENAKVDLCKSKVVAFKSGTTQISTSPTFLVHNKKI